MSEICITELMSNDTHTLKEAASVLLKICGNILKEPGNLKYRSISLSSSVFIQKLLPAEGALSCLFAVGFREGTDSLILPPSAPLENLKKLNDILLKINPAEKSVYNSAMGSVNYGPAATSAPSVQSTLQIASPAEAPKRNFSNSVLSPIKSSVSNKFLLKVIHYSDFVLNYQDKELQQKALQCIPSTQLAYNVEKAIRSNQESYKKNEIACEHDNYQEFLLLALLSWFKKDFFSWVDSPPCHVCHSEDTISQGTRPPSLHSMDRVEVYSCKNCGAEVLFPRYNDPNELLRMRRGRCGEWANCFTLMCIAIGWDARLVVDETDHVWTEVYLSIPKRWVHCDPCEAVLDTPLMYESGWGKKLSYVMAYSHEEVQDVTWRYSSHHKDLIQRRTLTTENDLINVICGIRAVRMEGLSQARRNFLLKRTAIELADMLIERSANDSELQGRMSGSLAWRQARGETGALATGHIWNIGPSQIHQGQASVGYSTVHDSYFTANGKTKTRSLHGWQAGVFFAEGIQLKVEKDWKMTYLARSEGCENAKIVWKFALTAGLIISHVSIAFKTALYQSGKVSIVIKSDDRSLQMPEGTDSIETDAFCGRRELEITAELSGGDGNCAWQHTQLFRQSIEDDIAIPFFITLHVKT